MKFKNLGENTQLTKLANLLKITFLHPNSDVKWTATENKGKERTKEREGRRKGEEGGRGKGKRKGEENGKEKEFGYILLWIANNISCKARFS